MRACVFGAGGFLAGHVARASALSMTAAGMRPAGLLGGVRLVERYAGRRLVAGA